jgi:hypothetical protein
MSLNTLELTRGEMFVKEAVQSWGWYAAESEEYHNSEVTGENLWIQNPKWVKAYSVCIIENLDQYGSFWIDPKECMSLEKKNHRFWHVNVDTRWMAWYSREDVQDYIASNNITEPFQVRVKGEQPFEITRRKYEV